MILLNKVIQYNKAKKNKYKEQRTKKGYKGTNRQKR